jgi:ABC-type nitrate/sulfonate/bicarbonate transport system ATPase subunit
MTIDGNLRFVLEGTGLARDDVEDRIATVLELMGLADFRRYHPHQLSGGMQQRVAIARALAFRPDVILMDEPFSHLDEITARLMRAEMTALWQRTGTTVLFVTHDLAEACFLAQRILLLTPKPTRVHEALTMDLPYPRVYGTDPMFEAERRVLREFEASISVGLNARQKERLGLQPSAA